MSAEITYKTHILIGVRENGVMTVIADWPHLPRQSEVQDRMNDARNGYVSFALFHTDLHHTRCVKWRSFKPKQSLRSWYLRRSCY